MGYRLSCRRPGVLRTHYCNMRAARADEALVPHKAFIGGMNTGLVNLRNASVGLKLDARNHERIFPVSDLNHVITALAHIRRVLAIGAEHEINSGPAPAVRCVVE